MPDKLLIVNQEFGAKLAQYSEQNGNVFGVCTTPEALYECIGIISPENPIPILIEANLLWNMNGKNTNPGNGYKVAAWLIQQNIPLSYGLGFVSFLPVNEVFKQNLQESYLFAQHFDHFLMPLTPEIIREIDLPPLSIARRGFINDYLLRENALMDKLGHELAKEIKKDNLDIHKIQSIANKIMDLFNNVSAPVPPSLYQLALYPDKISLGELYEQVYILLGEISKSFRGEHKITALQNSVEGELVIVEDDAEDLLMLKERFSRYFTFHGVTRIKCFSEGEPALRYIKENSTSVAAVFADIELLKKETKQWQRISGIEILQALQDFPHITGIGLTYYSKWARNALKDHLNVTVYSKSVYNVWPEYINPMQIIKRILDLQAKWRPTPPIPPSPAT